MQPRFRRIALTIVSVAVGGYLLATGGCLSFIGEQALTTIDVCFVIDCTEGLSGLLQPCDTTNGPALFVDCAGVTQGP